MALRNRGLSCGHCASRNHSGENCLEYIRSTGGSLPVWLKIFVQNEDSMRIKVNSGVSAPLNQLVHMFTMDTGAITVSRMNPGEYAIVSTGPIYINCERRDGQHLELAWVPGSLSVTERFVINQGYMVTRSRANIGERAHIERSRGNLRFFSPNNNWMNQPLRISVFDYDYYILLTPTGPVVMPEPEYARSMAWLDQFREVRNQVPPPELPVNLVGIGEPDNAPAPAGEQNVAENAENINEIVQPEEIREDNQEEVDENERQEEIQENIHEGIEENPQHEENADQLAGERPQEKEHMENQSPDGSNMSMDFWKPTQRSSDISSDEGRF